MDFFNHHLASDIESVYLLTSPEWQYVSSSRVRELIHFQADISAFVPDSVVKKWRKNMTILNAFKGILKKLGRILYRLKWWILGAVGTVFSSLVYFIHLIITLKCQVVPTMFVVF